MRFELAWYVVAVALGIAAGLCFGVWIGQGMQPTTYTVSVCPSK